MRPDERALRDDLASVEFFIGERRGKWSLARLDFPYAMFYVAAAGRPSGPARFLLRSECSGYRQQAPTSQLWHGKYDRPLAAEHLPRGPNGVLIDFQLWGNCLYHPVDRLAVDHNNWRQTHPDKVWQPEKGIVFLMETVHEILDGSDYLGANLPPEALELQPEHVEAHSA